MRATRLASPLDFVRLTARHLDYVYSSSLRAQPTTARLLRYSSTRSPRPSPQHFRSQLARMGKAQPGTSKALDNAMKSKGLQKLRW